jgi:Icc-related predicted phosphoesterase
MKIIATSDLHGAMPNIPSCDILLIGGDTVAQESRIARHRFNTWLADTKAVKAKNIVLIAGNHDGPEFYLKQYQAKGKRIHYLFNESVEVEGITIFGTPYTNPFQHWNFMPDDKTRKAAFDKIPKDVKILLSHGPEWMVQDTNKFGVHCGDKVLAKAITEKTPYMHVYGHIHEGYGYTNLTGTHSYNVSYVDGNYHETRKLVEIVLDKNGKIV